ncbi:YppG family protein [Bacillus sp. CGMCC 1.16607]|uniref:YppG family protein n=1 Tax=Bacillus sp. CGMCC 1.16607 TaxID=3351842 RepID=UPI00363F79B5
MQSYNRQYNQMELLNMGNPYYPSAPIPMYSPFHQNPYVHQPYSNYPQNYSNNQWNNQQSYNFHTPYSSALMGTKSNVQSIFHNPLEPKNPYTSQMQMNQNQMNYNPYPKPNMIPRPNGGFGTIMNSFKGQDGNLDLNKMMNTAGQMVNAVSQVSSMVKGLGGFFKV